ncbi:MAG TPA: CBS domain-containing protein [Bradyrhizobium sp.]|uniref:CBS domain-containing protein n=1 Tax=Bradyrhizobium sp. TaxID=376 RepID=UPI002CB46D1C|nr:CBS domain-containing protein [Bradyrhizobium sp.]HLZ03749.1 CBS domain-containing protein [Bradyrhizobium sp.]
MRAHQIMTRNVISVDPDATVAEAANLMLRKHISGLPVVDKAGTAVGILSEGDFLRRSEIGTPRQRGRLLSFFLGYGGAAEDYVREHGRKVSEIMTRPPITVSEQASLPEIVAVMERKHIKRVPVVRDGKVVGIVSRSNLLQALASLARDVPDPTADDDHIRRRIIAEIEKYDWRPIGLNVIVRDGIVHLSGSITDERSRQAAIVAAENVEGVVKVHDHLCWTDLETGYFQSSPEDDEWAKAS